MMSAIDGVVNLAAASEMDLGEASDMVTDYLSAFGLSASDAGKMVDEMVYAQAHSNTTTKMLGEAFGNSAAQMNAAGQSMETTTAILEAMADQGTKGSEAGTALSAVMRDITAKMRDGAIQIGKTSVKVQDENGDFRDLIDIMLDVEDATKSMGDAEKASALQKTFTARSIKSVNEILNEGVGSIQGYKDALLESDGAAEKTAKVMQDNLAGSVTEFKSAAEGLGIAIYDGISEPLSGIVDIGTSMIKGLTDLLTPDETIESTILNGYLDEVEAANEATAELLASQPKINTEKLDANIGELEKYKNFLAGVAEAGGTIVDGSSGVVSSLGSIGDAMPGLKAQVDPTDASVNLLSEDLSGLTAADAVGSFEDPNGYMAAFQTIIGALESPVKTTSGDLGTLGTNASGAIESLDDHNGNIEGLTSDLSKLADPAGTAAEDLGSLSEAGNTLSDALPGLNDSLGTLGENAAGVVSGMADPDGSVSEFAKGISGMAEPMGGVASNIDTVRDAVDRLSLILPDLQNHFDATTGKIDLTKEQLIDMLAVAQRTSVMEAIGGETISNLSAYEDILLSVNSVEEKSEFQKYQVKAAVEALADTIPELKKNYDETTGSINLSDEALQSYFQTAKEVAAYNAIVASNQDILTVIAQSMMSVRMASGAAKDATSQLKEELVSAGISISELERNTTNVNFSKALTPEGLEEVTGYLDVIGRSSPGIIQASSSLREANEQLAIAEENSKAAEEAQANLEHGAESLGYHIDVATGEIREMTDAEKAASVYYISTAQQVATLEEKNRMLAEAARLEAAGYTEAAAKIRQQAEALKISYKATHQNEEAAEDATEATKESSEAAKENTEAQLSAAEAEARAAEAKARSTAETKAQQDAEAAAARQLETTLRLRQDEQEARERAAQSAEQERKSLDSIRQAYEDNYNSIKNTLQNKLSLFDAFDGGEDMSVEEMLQNLESQRKGIEDYYANMAEVIDKAGSVLAPEFVKYIQDMGAEGANVWAHMAATLNQDNGMELLQQMSDEYMSYLDLTDEIAQAGAANAAAWQVASGQLGSSVSEWQGLKDVVAGIDTISAEMQQSLEQAVADAEASGAKIPDGLAEGLRNNEISVSEAIAQLTGASEGVFNGLYELAQQAGVNIPAGLKEGVENNETSYSDAISQLTTALADAGVEAGKNISEGIDQGLTDNADTIESAAGDAGEKMSDMTGAGEAAAKSYADGITANKSIAEKAASDLASAAVSAATKSGTMYKTGSYFVDGFVQGISANAYKAINAAIKMMRDSVTAARAEADVHSPSRVTYRIGDYLAQGLALGMSENALKAQEASQRMMSDTLAAARQYAQYEASMNTQVQPAVNVDLSGVTSAIRGLPGASVVNYITVSGAENPEDYAVRLSRSLKQQMRMG